MSIIWKSASEASTQKDAPGLVLNPNPPESHCPFLDLAMKLPALLMVLWLPKLKAQICHLSTLNQNLPVRYLHIQLTDGSGGNITESRGPLIATVRGEPSGECRFWKEVVDRFDGSYILRIRLLCVCDRLDIEVTDQEGNMLCHSPDVAGNGGERAQLPENCHCPTDTLEDWFESNNCSQFSYTQLEKDLEQWKEIDFPQVIQGVEESWGHPSRRLSASLCHYRILGNEIYRKCYGEYVGFRMFTDELLQSLSRKMTLPNTEFIMNLGDWPLQSLSPEGVPVVSWCGSTDSMDIVWPTYELTQAVLGALQSVTLDIHTVRGKKGTKWSEKKSTAVFRGRDSNELRLAVAKLVERRPDLVSGGITRYFFFDKSKNPSTVNHTKFHEFFKHKYVISIDGTVAAYRFPLLLSGDSVILKSDSRYYEHFYADLKPHIHYVPFKSVQDLEGIIQDLEANPDKAKKIISNANQFVQDHLQPLNIFCYHAKFFREYSKRITSSFVPVDGMEKVGRFSERVPEVRNCRCSSLNQDGHQRSRDEF
uniref:CAP10 domain-containing protein n=1 Tax=Steinernema glaseri TaxID=37863 RepID=A0A1I7Y2A0_9BILA